MARSPLTAALSRAFRLIRASSRSSVPLDEVVARDDERRALTRRRFLEASAAAAAIPILATGCDAPDPPGNGEVIIVGGGVAGVHCAYRLKQLGITAKIYEAGARLGGRMFSERKTFPDGMHCELGGELIDTGHETMRDLASELQIDLLDYLDDAQNGQGAPISDHLYYIDGKRLTMAEILGGFAPIAKKIDDAFEALTDPEEYVTYDAPNGGAALDALSIRDWLDKVKVDPSDPMRQVLEVAYNTEFGLETDVSNVLNMLFSISTDTKKFEIFGESDERFHTKDGNDTFITKMAESLDDAQVILGARLVALRQNPDGRYALSFARDKAVFDVTTDHVVLALPFSILRDVEIDVDLPAEKAQAIAEMGYGTNSKLMCGFAARPWRDDPYLSNGEVFTDLPFQLTWETSRLQPGKSGIITQFSGGDLGLAAGDGTPSARMAEFLDQYDQIFAGAKAQSNGKVIRMHWPTNPLVKGSYSSYKTGQYTAFAGSEIERFQNLHFCGEHTSLDAQGYMEGGALTGAMAADEVAADLGVDGMKALALDRGPRAALRPASRILTRARLARRYGRWHTALFRWAKASRATP